MSAPLDLDAIKARYESTRLSAGPWWPLMHKVPTLIAEVERQRAEVERQRAEIEALRADSVPRSALVQVGWAHPNVRLYNTVVPWFLAPMDAGTEPPRPDDVPVWIFREDSDEK